MRLLARRWQNIRAGRPVFITSLPRAGTTVLLDILHRLPGLASHTYRDMPFVLTPVLWHSVSSAFQRRGTARERAHGDGLAVSEDSPEAFEEVLWKKFYPDKYAGERIALWTAADADASFAGYFTEHMRKVIALREPEADAGRYLSKNNGNIARIELLRNLFPDATILVPVRHPVEHALSMLRQHRNFLEQHAKEPFTREYMADIGHFEFGSLHKPFAFAGFAEAGAGLDPGSVEYWLAYWLCAFEHLAGIEGVRFVCFEQLCMAGAEGIARIAEHLQVTADSKQLADLAAMLRPPKPRRDDLPLPTATKTQALDLYTTLTARSLPNA